MKTPRPWYRKQNDTWSICRRGKHVPLCGGKDNKTEAERRYFNLMAASDGSLPEPATLTVARVADLFLEWSQRHNAPATYEWYKGFLRDFCDLYGGHARPEGQAVRRHPPARPARGLERGSRRAAVTCLKRAYNRAEAEGILTANPVKKVAKPPPAPATAS